MTRFRSLLIFGLMTLAASGYLAAQEKPRREERSQQYPGSNPHLNNKESIRGGMSLYRRMCGECHALDATGYRGPSLIAYMANGAADEALFQVIRRGVQGTEMPQSNRPDHEILQIIAYLRNMGAVAPAESVPAGNVANGAAAVREAVSELPPRRRQGRPPRARPEPHRRGAHARGARARDSHAARMDSARLRNGHGRHEGRAEDSRRQEERRCVFDSGDGHARAHPGISEVERRSDATTKTR